jgi:hypothetical protein
VKFLRHLAAVVLVVAAIVGLGMLWAHATGSGVSGGTGGGNVSRPPSREALVRLNEMKAGVITGQRDDGFQLGDSGNLIRTCEIEAALAAVVITVSAVRRRRRLTRRGAVAGV